VSELYWPIDTKGLILWEVNIDLNNTDASSLAKLQLGSENALELRPWDQIKTYWPLQPPSSMLSINVGLDPGRGELPAITLDPYPMTSTGRQQRSMYSL
jgi:hypothetical protein